MPTNRPQSDTKPQSAGHTAEPWAVCGYGGPNASPDEYAVWAASATVAHIYPRSETSDPSATQAANAQRIVACVNACTGLATEQLGGLILRDVMRMHAIADGAMEAERDALRERVRALEGAGKELLREVGLTANRLHSGPADAIAGRALCENLTDAATSLRAVIREGAK